MSESQVEDILEGLDAASESASVGRSTEQLCEGDIKTRVSRARGLQHEVEVLRMWAGSGRAPSVREALLRNSAAPEEMIRTAWDEAMQNLRSKKPSDNAAKIIQAILSTRRGSQMKLSEIREKGTPGLKMFAAFLAPDLTKAERRELLPEDLSQLPAFAAAILYLQTKIADPDRLELADAIADWAELSQVCYSVVKELADNQGGVHSRRGRAMRSEARTNSDMLDRITEIVEARIAPR